MYEVPPSREPQCSRWVLLWVRLTSLVSMAVVALLIVNCIQWWMKLDTIRSKDILGAVVLTIVPVILYSTVVGLHMYPLRNGREPALGISIWYWALSILIAFLVFSLE